LGSSRTYLCFKGEVHCEHFLVLRLYTAILFTSAFALASGELLPRQPLQFEPESCAALLGGLNRPPDDLRSTPLGKFLPPYLAKFLEKHPELLPIWETLKPYPEFKIVFDGRSEKRTHEAAHTNDEHSRPMGDNDTPPWKGYTIGLSMDTDGAEHERPLGFRLSFRAPYMTMDSESFERLLGALEFATVWSRHLETDSSFSPRVSIADTGVTHRWEPFCVSLGCGLPRVAITQADTREVAVHVDELPATPASRRFLELLHEALSIRNEVRGRGDANAYTKPASQNQMGEHSRLVQQTPSTEQVAALTDTDRFRKVVPDSQRNDFFYRKQRDFETEPPTLKDLKRSNDLYEIVHSKYGTFTVRFEGNGFSLFYDKTDQGRLIAWRMAKELMSHLLSGESLAPVATQHRGDGRYSFGPFKIDISDFNYGVMNDSLGGNGHTNPYLSTGAVNISIPRPNPRHERNATLAARPVELDTDQLLRFLIDRYQLTWVDKIRWDY
jgi:hypothetical protein